ncbi:MAG: hypothetical protein ACFCUJ_13235 [Thiotrichales bacterium]
MPFFILAGYGFYLIYSLTLDVNRLSQNVTSMTRTMDHTMNRIAQTMDTIANEMIAINVATERMSNTTQAMSDKMSNVANAAQSMAVSTDNMRYDLRRINNSVSGPMEMVSTFMPFAQASNPPPTPVMFQHPPAYPYGQVVGYHYPYAGAVRVAAPTSVAVISTDTREHSTSAPSGSPDVAVASTNDAH